MIEALKVTRRDYDRMARRYADWVPAVFREQLFDLAILRAFAELVRDLPNRQIVDIGCGPGHVADWLDRRGSLVSGVDLSPVMVDLARQAYPRLRFEVGSMLDLRRPDASIGGVLAHFSVIHTPPSVVPMAFAEFARVLVPGGLLLLSFPTGDGDLIDWKPFDHTVSPAYQWSIDALAGRLAAVGFDELARLRVEAEPSDRFPGGHLLARKAVC